MTNVSALDLNAFLASVEKRAYRIARMATRSHTEALDIVQEAMLSLCEKYSQKPSKEWGPLFQRILQNKIMDWYRKDQRQRGLIKPLEDWDEGTDNMQNATSRMDMLEDTKDLNPEHLLNQARDMNQVIASVEQLPIRQQQAFLLRVWEGLDIQETAEIMQCSSGSVKTHFHRALKSIRSALLSE